MSFKYRIAIQRFDKFNQKYVEFRNITVISRKGINGLVSKIRDSCGFSEELGIEL